MNSGSFTLYSNATNHGQFEGLKGVRQENP